MMTLLQHGQHAISFLLVNRGLKRVTIGAHMLAGREVTTSPVELN